MRKRYPVAVMGVLIYARDRQLNSVGANGVSIRVSLLQNQNNTTDSPQIFFYRLATYVDYFTQPTGSRKLLPRSWR